MKEFFIGLLVLLAIMIFSVVAIFLLPFIVVMGFFLKWVVVILLFILAVWLLGKFTLMAIEYAKRKE